MENSNISQFRKLLNTFNDKFQIHDETNIEIDYKNPTKLMNELQKYNKEYDKTFKKYLKENYIIEDEEKIKEFIEKNPKITGFLYEITPKIKEKFPNYNYSLEYVIDPEIEDWEQLSLNILTDFDKEDITQLVEEVISFATTIHETKRYYKLINKFMMDVKHYE